MLKPGQKNIASLWELNFESYLCSIQWAENPPKDWNSIYNLISKIGKTRIAITEDS